MTANPDVPPAARPPLHVLVVAGGPAGRELTETLERAGHEVFVAAQAGEAVAMARFQLFDLMISEFDPPDVGGGKMLAELRKTQPRLRAIAVCGPSADQGERRAAAAGFDRCLARPIEEPRLRQAIAQLAP